MTDRPAPQRVEVLARERVLQGFFQVDRVRLRYERYNGAMSAPVERLVFERGDAVAVLPYDRERRQVVLVQQFRYPAYAREPRDGWLWEVIAGMLDEGENAEDAVRREALEEAGYVLGALHPIATFYVSPGGSTERINLYWSPATRQAQVSAGGGLPGHEDIRVHAFDLDQALRMIADGRIVDAKTIVALQYLALHELSL